MPKNKGQHKEPRESKGLPFFKSQLLEQGYIYKVCSGLQFDLNTVIKKTKRGYEEGHFCDHNCGLDCGNYQCPAAFTENKGVDISSTMKFEEVLKALEVALKGLELANIEFLKRGLADHARNFNIPKTVQSEIEATLKNGGFELNLFGGNPELHPNFVEIIKSAKNMGWTVTTTTTGKKFMYDADFTERFLENPPNLLAMSADDYVNTDELEELMAMSTDDLKKYWQKANPLYGQRKKAYESLYVAKLAKSINKFPKLLFNIVIHPGNLPYIFDFVDILSRNFPKTLINPYPAQSSFCYQNPVWQPNHLPALERVVNFMIQKQEGANKSSFVPRVHYWLALKSIFLAETTDRERCSLLSGHAWNCYKSATAGRYLQASSSETVRQKNFSAGGHPGCFWNRKTVTDASKQLWTIKTKDVATYLLEQKATLSKSTTNPCPGCIMPRLMFDGISTESGLSPILVPTYLKLRKEHHGF